MYDPTNSRFKYYEILERKNYRRIPNENNTIKSSNLTNTINNIPAHGSYGALLFRPEWKQKRFAIIKRDKSCKICKSNLKLQVHHRQYHFIVRENKFKLPWEYPENLLITLCESCHKRGHNKFKVLTINI